MHVIELLSVFYCLAQVENSWRTGHCWEEAGSCFGLGCTIWQKSHYDYFGKYCDFHMINDQWEWVYTHFSLIQKTAASVILILDLRYCDFNNVSINSTALVLGLINYVILDWCVDLHISDPVLQVVSEAFPILISEQP